MDCSTDMLRPSAHQEPIAWKVTPTCGDLAPNRNLEHAKLRRHGPIPFLTRSSCLEVHVGPVKNLEYGDSVRKRKHKPTGPTGI